MISRGTRTRARACLMRITCLLLTQDALPADEYLVERLAAAFTERRLKRGIQPRQLARPDCRELERYYTDL